MANDTILDMDALLDTNLGSVEDIPDFANPPAGVYMLSIQEAKIEKFEYEAKEGKPASKGLRFKTIYKVQETIETNDMPVANGTLFSLTNQGNEDGIKYFKKQSKAILNEDLGDATIRDILEALNAVEPFKAVITIRQTPNPKGGVYENVNVRPVHEA